MQTLRNRLAVRLRSAGNLDFPTLFRVKNDPFHYLLRLSVDAAAVNVKQVSNLGWGVAIHAKQEGLQTQRDTGGFVALSVLTQSQELAAGAGIPFGEKSFHSIVCRTTNAHTLHDTDRNSNGKPLRRAPSSAGRKRPKPTKGALAKASLKCMSRYLCAGV